jgi:hypothetical protein
MPAALTIATGDPNVPLSVTVTGTLTDGTDEVVFPELTYGGVADTKPFYSGGLWIALWTGTQWLLDNGTTASWTSSADVASPEMVPAGAWHASTNPDAWKAVSPATGTPIVTASSALGTAHGQSLQVLDTEVWYKWDSVNELWVQDGGAVDAPSIVTALNIATYADLTAANAALPIGTFFFNTATNTLAITTA